MAESSVSELSKLKLAELRRELKARGLSSAGAKSELLARLQEAAAGDEADAEAEAEAEYTLDSDEIDSDGVLEESDIILDETALGIDKPDPPRASAVAPSDSALRPDAADKPRTLKRKPPVSADVEKLKDAEKDPPAKKIVLHRPASIPASELKTDDAAVKVDALEKSEPESDKKPAETPADPKERLKLRAQRFGLPMTEEERKEARKIRFGRTGTTVTTSSVTLSATTAATDGNVDKLKKRAERFGQSVSKAMTDVDAEERLEKRRAKFGLVK